MEKARDDFEDAGLGRAVIGNGRPDHIPGFRNATGWSADIFTDPDKTAYQALGLARGMSTMTGLKSIKSLAKSVFSGHLSTAVQGDALQQGGVLVAGPGDAVHFLYRNREAGDYAGADVILKNGFGD